MPVYYRQVHIKVLLLPMGLKVWNVKLDVLQHISTSQASMEICGENLACATQVNKMHQELITTCRKRRVCTMGVFARTQGLLI